MAKATPDSTPTEPTASDADLQAAKFADPAVDIDPGTIGTTELETEPTEGNVIRYKVTEHSRVITDKDFKTLVPGSELETTEWSIRNRHRVDVSGWSDSEKKALLEADSNFELV